LIIAATVPLEKETFERLVISGETAQGFKETVIRHHGEKLMSEVVAAQICSMRLAIPKNAFDAAWDILGTNQKSTLMLNHLSILKSKDFEACFSVLGMPYHEFADRSRRHDVIIPDSEDHRSLAKRLQEVGYITSYDFDDCIKEYDLKSNKMVDRPAIRCRVKANSPTPEKK